jgi:hypothetical protein
VVALISATATATGLSVVCVIDESCYETGIKVSDEELENLNIVNADFHGEWNYSIIVNS